MEKASRIFDGLLVLRFRAGEMKALGILVKRHHRHLVLHACWYTHDLESAKDIVQDSWQKIIHKIGQLDDPDKFGSWAMTIVRRKALDYLSASKVRGMGQIHPKEEIVLTENEEEEIHADRTALLRAAIKGLPADQQEVLRLFYIETLSLNEIGKILEIPVGTVKSRLYHAREKLKSLLNEKHEKRNGTN